MHSALYIAATAVATNQPKSAATICTVDIRYPDLLFLKFTLAKFTWRTRARPTPRRKGKANG